jgi:hypothetical protein
MSTVRGFLSLKSLSVVAALGLVLYGTGCKSSCAVIVDKLNECNDTNLEPNPNCQDELFDCSAECYDNASCDEIRTNDPSFATCVQECG